MCLVNTLKYCQENFIWTSDLELEKKTESWDLGDLEKNW